MKFDQLLSQAGQSANVSRRQPDRGADCRRHCGHNCLKGERADDFGLVDIKDSDINYWQITLYIPSETLLLFFTTLSVWLNTDWKY